MNNLKKLRKLNNYTQKQLGDFLNTTQTNYSKLELGKIALTEDLILKLAKLYNVSPNYILNSYEEEIVITKEQYKKLVELKNLISEIEETNDKNINNVNIEQNFGIINIKNKD